MSGPAFGPRDSRPQEIGTIVVGGGIVGLCLAGFLAAEGGDVVVIDDSRLGGTAANAGSLHVQMQSRFIRLYPALVPRLEGTLHLYPKAVAVWQALQRDLGADFELEMTGGLMVAETIDQFNFLATKCRRERELGLNVTTLDRSELERIAPYLAPSVVGAELCADEGKLNPLLCNAAIRRWVVQKGVGLIEDEHVERVRQSGNRFELETASRIIRAGRLALAAASGTKMLAAALHVSIPAEAEPLHMNITEPTEALIGHLIQHAERQITLKQLRSGEIVIGGGWPARFAGARRFFPTVELGSLIANVTLAQNIVPRIGPLRIIRTWAGLNTTVDGLSVMGPVSSVPGLFIAIPGDAGYTLGPLVARLVADSMLGRTPDEDLSPYLPERFSGPSLMPAMPA